MKSESLAKDNGDKLGGVAHMGLEESFGVNTNTNRIEILPWYKFLLGRLLLYIDQHGFRDEDKKEVALALLFSFLCTRRQIDGYRRLDRAKEAYGAPYYG